MTQPNSCRIIKLVLRRVNDAALQSGRWCQLQWCISILPHLSTFLCGDVFLKGHHIGDGLDGNQVNTWEEEAI